MRRRPAWLGAAVALLALAGLLYWRAQRPPSASAATGLAPPALTVIISAPVATTAAGPAAVPLASVLLRSALTARFRDFGGVRESLGPLYDGDVAGAARALGQSRQPGAAAALAELATLCSGSDDPAGDGARTAEARGRLAAARDRTATAALESLIEAERAARARLRAGCVATAFDRAAIERKLGASAQAGDAASLERLAASGALPVTRLQSAAVLGSPRAAQRLGLDRLHDEPLVARSWLEMAARGDADAEAFYAHCLLAGCFGAPDPVAGRAALESAARRGALYALGLLAAPAVPDAPNRWSPAGALVATLQPPGADAAGEVLDRYAWSRLAGELAASGCFGFELTIAADALGTRARLDRTLALPELALATGRARDLATAIGATIRQARGCD